MDELIAATAAAPGCRLLSGTTVISVRFLPGDNHAQAAVLGVGLPWVSSPGKMAGSDPFVCWRSTQELIFIGLDAAPLRPLLDSLAPGRHELALATDLSEALAVFELRGPGLDRWLHRLVDTSAVPKEAGCVSRCRFADIAVMLLRPAVDCMWLVVEQPLVPHVSDWLSYAHAGARVDHSAQASAGSALPMGPRPVRS